MINSDLSLANSVNLIDTAETYPVPPHPETQWLTEYYIGSWLKRVVSAKSRFGQQSARRAATILRSGRGKCWIAKTSVRRRKTAYDA
ncbi:MAG: hypothetical protein GPOALKHO_001937 [Sodalis sp.]|nr:MAG: hypothetical protein GPOALKHO_001937 [Sodalis sp.]